MLIIKILLCLAFYPIWSSTKTVDEEVNEAVKTVEDATKYKAFDDFNSRRFGYWSDWDTRVFMELRNDTLTRRGPRPVEEYDTIVLNAIKIMTLLTNKLVDSKIYNAGNYRWSCGLSDFAPIHVLEYIKLRLVTECHWYPPDYVKYIAKYRSALKEIFRRFEVTNQPIPDSSLYLRKFMDSQGILSEDNLKDMDVFKSWFPTYERAIYAFFDELGESHRDDWNKGDGCYLLELITRSSFNYSRIDSFVKKLKDQLKDLEFISENCAKAMYSGSSYIEERANETSKMTDLIQTNSTKWLNEYLEIFRRFEVTNQPIPDPICYSTKFSLDGIKSMKDMDVFKKEFPTYEKAIDALFDQHPFVKRDKEDWNKRHGCYLRELLNRSSFNYTHIDIFVKELQNQLKDLEFLSKSCDKALFSESSTIKGRAEETSAVIALIQTNSTKWLNEYMAAAWPLIHNQIFQDQIRDVVRQPGYFDREVLKNVSDLTNSILKETGTLNYTYDMLIVKAPKENFQFYFIDLPINSHYSRGWHIGLATVLVRRPLNYTKNVEKVSFENLRTNITCAMKDLYDTKYVKEVAEGLKNKLGSFVSENGFQGFAIARKWEKNIFKSCSAIEDVQYSEDSFSTIYNFTYQNTGNMLQHCETFNFYFFV
ncbi:unnamed protein product [Caenorhabditis brenneri]